MEAWRKTPIHRRPIAWCIQETHVTTAAEVSDLQMEWKRLWGKHVDVTQAPMSFWSIGASKAAGVAILLTPQAASDATAWNEHRWNPRAIGVKIQDMTILNVYSPNIRAEREDFFTGLLEWNMPVGTTVLLGDFNSVQSPQLDRLGQRSASRPESPALEGLLQATGLSDARLLRDHAEDDESADTTDHFTYWNNEKASRIDRIYVPHDWAPQVIWVSSTPPPLYSDHQQVELHLRNAQSALKPPRRRQPAYPIKAHQPDRVLADLLREMDSAAVGRTPSVQSWDADINECINCIRAVTRREQQRRKRFISKIRRRNRRQFLMRRQWISANMEEMREEHLLRMGENLERSAERLKWSYKRVANWERNQLVTSVRARHGEAFGRHMSIADKFASEWAPVLSSSHRTTALEELPAALKNLVTIPKEQQLTDHDNERLLQPITETEVLSAIRGLSRHKAAGQDGLNNDFYKDTSALLVPALVSISNEILNGADLPPSFLEALIIPLRKKGDSDDAMDYRPISLLQTSYKVFAKVLATRLQLSLPRAISDSQQGFVRGRKMSKPVMMMMAQLSTAMEQEEVPTALSRCILLLDFKKAYDTVDRDFLYATLRQFSFDERFIDLIRRIHTGTTASFVVNGCYSTPLQVRSGIRQGCPLAPLLFLLAVEVLGLALLQDPNLKGLQVPGQPGQTHLYSAFVDDTTLFLETAEQIPHALHVVRAFGALAGLQVQPAKSQLIFLNRSVMLERYEGMTVVPAGATTRYLGYEVGTGELVNKNWAQRIRKIQRRLLTATRVATSVENRVLILNSIVLPSLLFTAIVFELPRWAEKELHNLYKQFLWAHATTTESSRHKVNPGLLVTPKQAGGIGLAAVSVAVKTQRTKHAFAWLTQKPDKYYTAWRMWTFRNNQGPAATIVTPAQAKLRASFNRAGSPGHELRQELGERLSPTTDQQDQVTAWRHAHSSALLDRAISWWEGDELVLSFIDPFPIRLLGYDDMPEEIQRFWATFNWSANPWIRDQGGNMLARTTYNRIEDCTLEQLHIRRTGPAEFVLRIPIPQDQPGPHSNAKLRRWATAILLSSPDLPIGSELHAAPPLRLRQAPPCLRSFRWKLLGAGLIEGHSTDIKHGQTRPVTLHQADDGLHWFCHGFLPELTVGSPSERQAVCREIRTWGLVFEAHPQLHRFPWSVPTTTSNHFVTKALGKQAFRFHKKVLARQLSVLIDRLSKSATTDEWQCAALRQTPRQVWDHSNGLTPYQVWTGYRVATRQLNLYHATRYENNSCRKAPACSGSEETIGHLFWDCACAAALWGKLIGHWTGQQVTRQATKHFVVACASRRVHSIPEHRMQSLADRFQDDTDAAERVWTRIWHVLATICHTRLWVDRNAAVYKAVPLHLPSSIASFWASCLCQLRAIAKREHQKVASATTGALLYACIELLEREPRGPPLSTVTSHDLQSGQPALTSWLRTFQRSCT